jgi:hypothetical protein
MIAVAHYVSDQGAATEVIDTADGPTGYITGAYTAEADLREHGYTDAQVEALDIGEVYREIIEEYAELPSDETATESWSHPHYKIYRYAIPSGGSLWIDVDAESGPVSVSCEPPSHTIYTQLGRWDTPYDAGISQAEWYAEWGLDGLEALTVARQYVVRVRMPDGTSEYPGCDADTATCATMDEAEDCIRSLRETEAAIWDDDSLYIEIVTHDGPCRIWAEPQYYPGTAGAPRDDFARDDSHDIREYATYAEAQDWIDEQGAETYYLQHGEHSRPTYTIVEAE